MSWNQLESAARTGTVAQSYARELYILTRTVYSVLTAREYLARINIFFGAFIVLSIVLSDTTYFLEPRWFCGGRRTSTRG